MGMKGYSTFVRSLKVDPCYKMQFSVISRTPHFWGWGALTLQQRIQSAYSKLPQQGYQRKSVYPNGDSYLLIDIYVPSLLQFGRFGTRLIFRRKNLV